MDMDSGDFDSIIGTVDNRMSILIAFETMLIVSTAA
jgi:hypothetical protein